MNKVIKILIFSDFLIFSGFGLFAPILAVFITGKIAGATLITVGIATTVYWIVTSITRIPLSKFLDKTDGEYDDFIAMICGMLILILVPFLYIFAKNPWHLYFINALYGLGTGLTNPPWYGIFTRHIDRFKESFEWSVETLGVGIGSALSALVGSWLADKFGFSSVFILASIINLCGAIVLLKIFYDLKKRVKKEENLPFVIK